MILNKCLPNLQESSYSSPNNSVGLSPSKNNSVSPTNNTHNEIQRNTSISHLVYIPYYGTENTNIIINKMFLFINRIIISIKNNNNNNSISDNIFHLFSITEPLIIRGPSCLFEGSCSLFLSIILTHNSFQRKSFKTILKRLYGSIKHNNIKVRNSIIIYYFILLIYSL